MVKNMNNQQMFQKMMTLNVPKTVNNAGKYSFGIVNSKNNGKRITFNKALSHALGLTDKVTVMPDVEEGKVALCRSLVFPHATEGNLRGDESKICYNTAIVKMLSTEFSIDFSTHTSRTFNNIEIDEFNGVPVAIVTFPKA